jgi:dihydroorotase
MQRPTRKHFLGVAAGAAGWAAFYPWLPTPQVAEYDVLIRGGRVIDPAQGLDALVDVGILNGRIASVAPAIPPEQGSVVVDARGKVVTPGLIDAHVHVYNGVSRVAIEADPVGVSKGVTTLIDGGSAGAVTFPGFRRLTVSGARSRVYALLNIAESGMTVRNETADLVGLDSALAAETILRNRDVIVGLKVRMLAGIPDGQDLEVMRRTREASDLSGGVPIMVHIGGQTSPLPRILDFLRPGDVITHAMRRQGSVLDGNGRVYPEVREAVANGIFLDIGHGRGNLDFDVAEQLLDQGVTPHTISSDVHRGNAMGPVFGLPTTLSKFMQMGMSLGQVIESATSTPAKIFDLGEELGTLAVGAAADIGIFELVEGDYALVDSGGKTRRFNERLAPFLCIRDGEVVA